MRKNEEAEQNERGNFVTSAWWSRDERDPRTIDQFLDVGLEWTVIFNEAERRPAPTHLLTPGISSQDWRRRSVSGSSCLRRRTDTSHRPTSRVRLRVRLLPFRSSASPPINRYIFWIVERWSTGKAIGDADRNSMGNQRSRIGEFVLASGFRLGILDGGILLSRGCWDWGIAVWH